MARGAESSHPIEWRQELSRNIQTNDHEGFSSYPCTRACTIMGGGECHAPFSDGWVVTTGALNAGSSRLGQGRASGKGRAGPRLERPFGVRQTDPEEFGVSVADRGSDFEEGTRPSLHKLVGYWSRTPDEPEAGRNQSEMILRKEADSVCKWHIRVPHGLPEKARDRVLSHHFEPAAETEEEEGE